MKQVNIPEKFTNGFNFDQFDKLMKSSVPSYQYSIMYDGIVLELYFSNDITDNELDALIQSFTPYTELGLSRTNYIINKKQLTNTAYEIVATVVYSGDIIKELTHVKALSRLIYGVQYTIQLRDKTGILASGTFTNTSQELNTLTILKSFPTIESQIDIVYKVDGTSAIDFASLRIYYN